MQRTGTQPQTSRRPRARLRPGGRWLLVALLTVAAAVTLSLALPVPSWRTGRMPVQPLRLTAPEPAPVGVRRVWIDTDAACGHSPRTDVDDCLALWLLATTSGLEVAGVSTVFGNAPLDVTDRVIRELVGRLSWRGTPVVVHRGSPTALGAEGARSAPAHAALVQALEAGPTTIVALGPLTNVAQTLAARPDLHRNVAEIVAVMGRRIGHLFHPAEGSGGGTLLGHGPVFRDFNFAADPAAVASVIGMRPPLTLIPYDAARHVEITGEDLRLLAARGEPGEWVARRARGWLEYWRTDIGRPGFYPFDLMAAAYVRAPRLMRCADVEAWVGEDPRMFLPLLRPQALLVGERARQAPAAAVRYCPASAPGAAATLRRWLAGEPRNMRPVTLPAATPATGRCRASRCRQAP